MGARLYGRSVSVCGAPIAWERLVRRAKAQDAARTGCEITSCGLGALASARKAAGVRRGRQSSSLGASPICRMRIVPKAVTVTMIGRSPRSARKRASQASYRARLHHRTSHSHQGVTANISAFWASLMRGSISPRQRAGISLCEL